MKWVTINLDEIRVNSVCIFYFRGQCEGSELQLSVNLEIFA